MKKILFTMLALAVSVSAFAKEPVKTQNPAMHWAVETNIVSWANMGTINAGASLSLGKKAVLHIDGRYNPWQFGKGENQTIKPSARELTFDFGYRHYFFAAYSGWWLGTKIQYENYCKGGIIHKDWIEQGDAFGLGVGGGYSLMVYKNLNIDFGLYVWGGPTIYSRYSSTIDNKLLSKGTKWFIWPDDARISLVWVF